MSVIFFGPIIAAVLSGVAIYGLLRMLKNSDLTTADKLARATDSATRA
jgi:hypothetical protein